MQRKSVIAGLFLMTVTVATALAVRGISAQVVPDHVCAEYQGCDDIIGHGCPGSERCDSCTSPYNHKHCIDTPWVTCKNPQVLSGGCGYWRYGTCDGSLCDVFVSMDPCNMEYCA